MKAPRHRLHTLLNLIGLVALVVVIGLNHSQLASFWHLLSQIQWYVICLMVAIQLCSFWVNGLYYRSILCRVFGYNIPIPKLVQGVLATNFVNYVLPTAGIAGAGYFSQVLTPEVPRGDSVLTQFVRYGLSALSVFAIMPLGLVLIALSGKTAHPIVQVILFSAIGILALALVLIVLINQEALCRKVVWSFMRGLKRVYPGFHKETSVNQFVDEWYVAYRRLAGRPRSLIVPFGWSLIYVSIAIVGLYAAFMAFGTPENLGVVIMAYLFANIASLVGGAIFNTGVFELSMAGTLIALGVPFVLAVSATTVFRSISLIVCLIPGFYFYRQYLP